MGDLKEGETFNQKSLQREDYTDLHSDVQCRSENS